MTVTRNGSFIRMTAAGDTVTERLFIRTIITTLDGTNFGIFTFKDGAGAVILTLEDQTVDAADAPLSQSYCIGGFVNGIEIDALPTTSIVTIIVD